MKYCFTTLAVGDPYEELSANFHKSLREKTQHCTSFITTNNLEYPDLGDGIIINRQNLTSLHDSRGGFSFHLNYKCLSLKHVLSYEKDNPDKKCDYVIFTDGDWILHAEFSEEKVLRMLEHIKKENFDFVFERPARIGDGRKDPENTFYRDKIYDYDILEYDGWDEAHVVNEQFLVFKNNHKFKMFVQNWEKFLWYSIQNDIRNYPDGFEIGVSALQAGMKWHYMGIFNHFLPSCFEFYTKLGDKHVRF